MNYIFPRYFTPLLFFLYSLCLLSSPTLAKAQEIDSLKLVLQRVTGGEKIDVLNQLSSLHHDTDTREALFYAREAIKYASSSGDKKRLSIAYINAGIVLRNTGQSDKALDYFFNAINLTESLNLPRIKADALHKISVAYLLINDFDNALRYGKEEELLWTEIHDHFGLSKALNSMGLIYINKAMYEEAEEALIKAKELGDKIGNPGLIAKPLLNLGDLYLTQQKYEAALPYIEQSLQISQESQNTFGLTGGYLKLGEILFGLKKYPEAIEAVKKARDYAKELQSLSMLRNAYKALGDISEEAGMYEAALEYNRLYISTEDSMIGEITKRKIAQTEARFEIEEMEREMERMEKESSYNSFRIAFIFALVLLGGILAVVLVNRRQLKRQTESHLQLSKEEIEQQNLALSEHKQAFETLNKKYQAEAAYAHKVQGAMIHHLPTYLNIFPDAFLHSLPLEQASGDVCWFAHKNDSVMIAVGDCEGSGARGALNTLVVHSLLTQIINESQYRTPADILRELDRKIAPIVQAQSSDVNKPKLRLAVCNININTKRLTYAGAQLPLYIFNAGQLKVVPGDPNCIEGRRSQQADTFNNQIIALKRNDKLMLITDGYQKQIGGDQEKALTEHKLVELLAQQGNASLGDIKTSMLHGFEDWKGRQKQTDDVLIFGLTV